MAPPEMAIASLACRGADPAGPFAGPAGAKVTRFEILERSDVLDGRAFGLAGGYERIVGIAHFAFDPELPANRIVADIGLAPVNAEGMVEMSAEFHLLRPKRMEKGRGTVARIYGCLYESGYRLSEKKPAR